MEIDAGAGSPSIMGAGAPSGARPISMAWRAAGAGATQPDVAGNARYLAFETAAGLVPADTNGVIDIYRAEIEAFSRAVVDDTEPPVSGEAGLWNQRVLAAAYESAGSGKAPSAPSGMTATCGTNESLM